MRILCLNPQGNFDKNDSYWTEHPDFGGQLVYVKEIATELAKLGHDVDIVTRYIDDPDFSAIQGQFDSYDGISNVRIVRLPCGPDNRFMRKELLWEHLEEWVDNIIQFYQDERVKIDFATGHYGDGGLACAMLKQKLGTPYSFTGHSLGAQKFDKLNHDFNNFQELEDKYFFTKRILAERTSIAFSDIVFVSTDQEKNEQYNHILYKDVSELATFSVVPPGANTTVFHAFEGDQFTPTMLELDQRMNRDIAQERRKLSYIIAASRLDPKKNHIGLLEAYAHSKDLQAQANLIISVRGIDNVFTDFSQASPKEQEILQSLLDLIKTYQLEGKVGFLNVRTQQELAETYRLLSTKNGIFTLTALYEPFGLAPIEAMSTGLPAVVTKYGGPSDVLKEDGDVFGVLIDVHSKEDIAQGLIKCIENHNYYKRKGMNRVYSTYTWAISAKRYLESIDSNTVSLDEVEIPDYFYTKNENDLDTNFILERYQQEHE